MTQSRRLRVALMVAVFGAALVPPMASYLIPAAYAEDKDKDKDKAKQIRDDLRKPLAAAQKLLTDKKYQEALDAMVDVDKVTDPTPYEAYVIAQFRAICYSNLKDTPNSVKYMAIMADSGQEDPESHLRTEHNLLGTYYNQKDYANAAKWAVRFLKDGGSDPQVETLLADAYYLSGDYPNAMTELTKQIAATEAAGQKPTEEDLHMLISCYIKLQDDAGYVRVMEKWAVDYPSKDRWRDLTGRIETRPGFADRLLIDVDRLLKVADALENADYLEWSQFSLDAGLPAEAKTVFSAGVAAGAINPTAQKQLNDRINRAAADDQKVLAQGDAELPKAKDGNPFVNNGVNYLIYGQYDKGAQLIEQGIAKGGLKHPDDAKLHLGYAYFLAGQKDKAVEVLKTVGGTEGQAGIARLWILYITGKSAA